MCLGILWRDLDCCLRFLNTFFRLPFVRQNSRQRQPWLDERRLQLNRGSKMWNCGFRFPLLRQDPSQSRLRRSVFGIGSDRFFEFNAREREIAFRECGLSTSQCALFRGRRLLSSRGMLCADANAAGQQADCNVEAEFGR